MQNPRVEVVQRMRQVIRMLSPMLPLIKGWSYDQKSAHWKAVNRQARAWEGLYQKGARKAFEHDRRELLALLKQAQTKALERKATISWEWLVDEMADYFNMAGGYWRKVFVPLIRGLVSDQGKYWSISTGLEFDVENLFARDWFNRYTSAFADPITATSERQIASLLNQGMREGWSIPETQKHIDTLFQQWTEGNVSPEDWEFAEERLPAYRTEMIARTETIRASNVGSHELFKSWGVKRKEWLSTRDDRTRTLDAGDEFDHLAMDGVVVDIDAPFIVPGKNGDEELMYPGDPNGSPANFINCRCTEIPVLPQEAVVEE